MKKLILLITLAFWTLAAQATIYTVTTSGETFSPSAVSIKVGDTVKWVCSTSGGIAHTTTSGTSCTADGKWNSGNMNPGATFSFKFTTAGTYNYYCTYHCSMGMTGTVTVSSASGISPETFTKIQFTLAPNPTDGQTYLNINLTKTSTLTVCLYNLAGKVISTASVVAAEGSNSLPLDVKNYPAGLYFVRVSGEGILPESNLLIKD